MRFAISSLVTAALAVAVSASPIVLPRGEVYTELPARFAMYIVTDQKWSNGLRVKNSGSNINVVPIGSPASQPWPGDYQNSYFVGRNGHVTLDPTVHHTDPATGDWSLVVFPFTNSIYLYSEEWQAKMTGWDQDHTIGKFVQNSDHMLRLINDGGYLPSGLKLCGAPPSVIEFWWDNFPYLNCPDVQFRIVPL